MKKIYQIFAATLMLMPLHAKVYATDVLGGTNYVATYTTVEPGVSRTVDVEYYDGLGYLSQRISSHATPEGGTLVTPIVYDNMRRADATAYLSYFSGSDACTFRTEAISQQTSYYATHYPNEGSPFSNTVYETGPKGRPLSIMKPGGIFRTTGRKSEMEYGVNDAADCVRRLIDHDEENTVIIDGYYPAGALQKVSTTDEDGHEVMVFSDAFGRKILSRSTMDNGYADTYFIYDTRDKLKYVIQPEGVLHIDESVVVGSSGISLDSPFIDLYCFTWKYDAWNNVVDSHVPGGGHCYYTYDNRDRVVMYRDSEMIGKGVAIVREYDNLDRIVNEVYGEYYGSDSDFFPIMDSHKYAYYSATSTGIPQGNRLSFIPDEVVSLADMRTDRCITLLSYEYVYTALKPQDVVDINDGGDYVERAYYYDAKGRCIQMVEKTSDGWTNIYSVKYDFVGNILSRLEKHIKPNGYSNIFRTDYTYDARGRVLSCGRIIDGENLDTVNYTYDNLGRLVSKSVHGKLVETHEYDMRGWTRGIAASRNTSTIFSEDIRYENPQMPGTESLYSGSISEIETVHHGNQKNIYSYTYDCLSRLADARHFIGESSAVSNTDTERFMEHDRNGNLTFIQRYGSSNGDVLSMAYNGNRLSRAVSQGAGIIYEYDYDSNGNRVTDSRTGLEFTYNLLNLPCELKDSQDNMLLRYTYLSDGTKISALNAADNGLLYKGNFVYEKTGQSIQLESIAWDEGRIRNTFRLALNDDVIDVIDTLPGISLHTMELAAGPILDFAPRFQDQWFVEDHLGNVRSVINLSKNADAPVSDVILEQNDYLPFGSRVQNTSYSSLEPNHYRYAGKEEQRFGNFNSQLLDFGARYYDPWNCQWTAVDPMAEYDFNRSCYIYCIDSPLSHYDYSGLTSYDVNGDIQEIDDGYYETIKVSKYKYNRLVKTWSNDKKKYLSTRERIMNSNGYLDSDGNPVLAASFCFPDYPSYIEWLSDSSTTVVPNEILTVSSEVVNQVGNSYYSVKHNRWKDKYGVYRKMSFNGNGVTGGKIQFAYAQSMGYRFLGKAIGVTGLITSFCAVLTAGTEQEIASSCADLVVSGLSFIPYFGPAVSLSWSAYGKYIFDTRVERTINRLNTCL